MWHLLARRLPPVRRPPKRYTLPGLPTALPHSSRTLYFDYIYWYLFTSKAGTYQETKVKPLVVYPGTRARRQMTSMFPPPQQFAVRQDEPIKNHHGLTACPLSSSTAVPAVSQYLSASVSPHAGGSRDALMPRFVHLQDAALTQRGTRGFGTCTSAEPNAARYSDFSPHFLSTLSALRLTSPVDADNLCRCESYSVTMPPNVGQPQYMPPQQPPQYQPPQQ